jgi:hypothetical protein
VASSSSYNVRTWQVSLSLSLSFNKSASWARSSFFFESASSRCFAFALKLKRKQNHSTWLSLAFRIAESNVKGKQSAHKRSVIWPKKGQACDVTDTIEGTRLDWWTTELITKDGCDRGIEPRRRNRVLLHAAPSRQGNKDAEANSNTRYPTPMVSTLFIDHSGSASTNSLTNRYKI